MSSDINKHKQWLRDMGGRTNMEALAAIEALEGENAALKKQYQSEFDRWNKDRESILAAANLAAEASGQACTKMEAAEARAERLRAVLKPRLNAKAVEALQEILEAMEGLDEADAPYLKTLLDWHENARKALEDDKQ